MSKEEILEDYMNFVNNSMDGKLLLLVLGVGFNTPGIIRWPFERIVSEHPDAALIKMNIEYPEVSDTIAQNSLCLDTDMAKAISDLRNMLFS